MLRTKPILTTALLSAFAFTADCAASWVASNQEAHGHDREIADAADEMTSGEDKLVCHYERQTGSHFAQKICRYQSTIDAERASVQRELLTSESHRARAGVVTRQ